MENFAFPFWLDVVLHPRTANSKNGERQRKGACKWRCSSSNHILLSINLNQDNYPCLVYSRPSAQYILSTLRMYSISIFAWRITLTNQKYTHIYKQKKYSTCLPCSGLPPCFLALALAPLAASARSRSRSLGASTPWRCTCGCWTAARKGSER